MPMPRQIVPRLGHVRRRAQPAFQQRVHVARHRQEAHEEAGQQVADEQPEPERHLQRRQRERQQHHGRVQADPDGDGTSWCPTAAAPRCRSRRTRTSCRTSCRWCAARSRRTSSPSARSSWRWSDVSHASRCVGGVEPVQRGPFLLHALDRPEELGAAEARRTCSPPGAAASARRGSRRPAPGRPGGSRPRSRADPSTFAPPLITCWVAGPSKIRLPRSRYSCRVELLIQACRWAIESKR